MMELKDFIEQSISEIIEALHSVKVKYNKNGRRVVAPWTRRNDSTQTRQINFDIAVVSSESNTSKIDGKAGISVIGGSIGDEMNSKNENSSRIKFSIPFYPEEIGGEI